MEWPDKSTISFELGSSDQECIGSPITHVVKAILTCLSTKNRTKFNIDRNAPGEAAFLGFSGSSLFLKT
jgi:hypothetical protein